MPEILTQIAQKDAFSFTYEGQSSSELLKTWKRTVSSQPLNDGRTLEVTTWLDPATGLEIQRELIRFKRFPTLEVMLRVRNTGKSDTPIIENLLPLRHEFTPPGDKDAIFHHVLGSAFRKEGWMTRDYSPIAKPLGPGSDIDLVHYVMDGWQHTDAYLPFFSLQWQGGGLIGGVGWTGQWRIHARRGDSRSLLLESGQKTTHFRLHPGESIRTPRVLLVQWAGADRITGHNVFRQVLVAHYVPRIGGEVQLPPIAYTPGYLLQFDDIAQKTGRNPLDVIPTIKQSDIGTKFIDQTPALNYSTEENQVDLIRRLPDIGLDTYWLDAGWFEGLWPMGRGSWVPKKEFPHGMKPLGDAAHARGLKFLLWFDPEGLGPGSIIQKEHPEWVLHHPHEGNWGGIYKWSDPEALRYMTELMSKSIRDWGVDIFRFDRNTVAVPFWEQNDTPDRQGITEIRQIEGMYTFFDTLFERFPKLTVDNANWRGTGPDLEMMKRSLGSLTRTELTSTGLPYPISDQVHTQELSLWIPLDSNLLHVVDPYNFRSTATTGVGICMNLLSPYVPADVLKKAIDELKSIRPYWLGDYYPLTRATFDENAWAGWQFHRSDMKAGFAVLFRRPKSTEDSCSAKLRGLDPKAKYEVTFAETYEVKDKRVLTGAELANLRVTIPAAPGSLLIRYNPAAGSEK